MKHFSILLILLCVVLSISKTPLLTPLLTAGQEDAYIELKNVYDFHAREPSDINEHFPLLRELSLECQSAIEIGMRNIVSTWAILQGLSENPSKKPSYLGIDIRTPPINTLNKANRLATSNHIAFTFWEANDMTIRIPPVDLLFIDSLHTYCHLTYELETFSPMIKKYIAMHDTSEPWGDRDDSHYFGDYSEYPQHYDRNKKGLWLAVADFLNNHPEWSLYKRCFNNHGFTVLRRNQENLQYYLLNESNKQSQ